MKIFCAPYQINYLLLLSMLFIGVNVGLESPRFAMRFVFIIGLSQYIVFEYYKTYLINDY